jgi:O-antigen/teichoic acid export membrane protein
VNGYPAGTNAPAATQPQPRAARAVQSKPTDIKAGWRRHQDLLRSAASLVATTGVASALGFAYWALAARLFSRQVVGYGSAAVSAMTLLGTIGMLGLGTVLIGELPRRRVRASLIAAALLASCIGSLILGVGFDLLAPHFSARFNHVSGTVEQAALFAAGVALTGVTLVFDQATIGLLRGGLQLTRNILFAAVKLLILPVTAFILHTRFGVGITLSWVTGMALSVVPVAAWLRFKGTQVLSRPDWGVLRGLGTSAVAHSWLNLSITVPRSLMPVLVTVIVSPAANAAFYAAWMLSGFLYIVPTHLATVLFAVASADPQAIARKLRFTLRVSAMIGLAGMAVLGLGAHLTLSLFGASYAREATVTLWLLVIGYLPMVPKMHYIAVCRAAGRIPRAAAVLTTAAGVEVAAAVLGGRADGLNGFSVALAAVFFLEGLITTPSVVRAAIGRGRHRRLPARTAGSNQTPSEPRPAQLPISAGGGLVHKRSDEQSPRSRGGGPAQPAAAAPASRTDIWFHAEQDYRQRQDSGVASLLALARAQPAPPPPRPVRAQPAPPRTGRAEPAPPSPPAGGAERSA